MLKSCCHQAAAFPLFRNNVVNSSGRLGSKRHVSAQLVAICRLKRKKNYLKFVGKEGVTVRKANNSGEKWCEVGQSG